MRLREQARSREPVDPLEQVETRPEDAISNAEGSNAIRAGEATEAIQASGELGRDRSSRTTALAGVAHASAPLPHLDRLQLAFGSHDLRGVRVTETSAAPDALGARAYTIGERIAFGAPADLRLAAHEAAHVVQQRQGVELSGSVGQPGDRYERQADEVAEAAATGGSVERILGRAHAAFTHAGPGLQFDAKPAADRRSQHALSTPVLLELAIARLGEVAQAGDMAAYIAASGVAGAVTEALNGTTEPDPDVLRQKAVRLNSFLVANQNIFRALRALERKDAYLRGVAATIVDEVERVARRYAVALQLAWAADRDRETFEMAVDEANAAMAVLPKIIIDEYLGRSGIEKEISRIEPEREKLVRLRERTSRAPLRGRVAEDMVGLQRGLQHKSTTRALEALLRRIRSDRSDGKDVTEGLKSITTLTQQALGVIYAMQVYEQVDAYAQELDNWINKGIELIWKEVLGKMRDYRHQVDDILTIFESDVKDFGWGQASDQRVASALDKLTTLVASDEFQKAIGAAEARLETIAVIRLVGKAIALTALAALGGAVAAEFASAGAVSLGAAEGGMAARGAAFIGNVLAFTAIQRTGQKQIFGSVEGSFIGDAFVNALMFGALKVAEVGFTKFFKLFADPKAWKVTFALGKAGVAFGSLAGFSEAHYAVMHGGKAMPGEERLRSYLQNVIMVAVLEAGRFITEPIAKRLSMPALRFKLGKRMEALDRSYAVVADAYSRLKRGFMAPDEVEKLAVLITKQWFDELKLLGDAAKDKVITGPELDEALGRYQRAMAELELQLSRINADAPTAPGRKPIFRPLDSGVVEFDPDSDALDILAKHYKGNFGESKTLKGGYEGRSPDGELTYYVPAGAKPKEIATAARIAAGRDAANQARANDPTAAAGFDRLSTAFGKVWVDELLAAVPADAMAKFLRLLTDPTTSGGDLSSNVNHLLQIAGNEKAIRFGRRYGLKLAINLYRRYRSASNLEKVLDEIDARVQADPEGTRSLLADLEAAGSAAEIEKLLGKEKAKPPKPPRPRITKNKLPVDRSNPEWVTVRAEVEKDVKAHNLDLKPDELDLWADCELVFQEGQAGRYRHRPRAQKLALLDAFDAAARAAKVPSGWMSSHRGNLSEALFNPDYGKPKPAFYKHEQVKGRRPEGTTIPDYRIAHAGFTEWVNQKSHDLDPKGPRDANGVLKGAKATARSLLKDMIGDGTDSKPGEANNIPIGDRYSLDFIRDPGPETVVAMLDILFGETSPLYRVRFGEDWHTNPRMQK
ncbi:MAG TPA: DUF4157 domain-containing protein [Kofleriaceae bacterium]